MIISFDVQFAYTVRQQSIISPELFVLRVNVTYNTVCDVVKSFLQINAYVGPLLSLFDNAIAMALQSDNPLTFDEIGRAHV